MVMGAEPTSRLIEDDRRSPERTTPTGRAVAGAGWGHHPIDIRLSIPFPSTRYYLTVIAGKERRRTERRAAERRKHPLMRRGNVLVFLCLGSLLGLAGLTAIQLITHALLRENGLLRVLP